MNGEDMKNSFFEHVSLSHSDVMEHQLLTLVQRDSIPGAIPVTSLDLTQSCLSNKITFLRHLESLTSLETIVLDKNELDNLIGFPPIPSLRCLWVNNNCISDLAKFIDEVSYLFPFLEELSMLRNPACPGFMDIKEPDHDSIKIVRTYVVWRLPRLRVLDGIRITDVERFQAKRQGPLAITHRPIGKKLGGVDDDRNRMRHDNYYKTAKRAAMKAFHKASAWWTAPALGVACFEDGRDSTGLHPKPKEYLNEDRKNSQPRLTIVTRRPQYSGGHHSEGNRYITDEEL